MRHLFFFSLIVLSFSGAIAQAPGIAVRGDAPRPYTIANTHSHNDYNQEFPFWMAYDHHFGSIEADIYLVDGTILVSHDVKDLRPERSLEKMYLQPLVECIRKNHGTPYADAGRKLQILIDVKQDSIRALDKLVETIRKYPDLVNCRQLVFTITGNRPDQSLFVNYPEFIQFDGELYKEYTQAALSRIVMLSDDFERYSKWNGKGLVPEKEWTVLQAVVKKSHDLGKPVRFWDAPDFINAWQQFTHLGVDFINTDHIPELSSFLNGLPKNSYIPTAPGYAAYQPSYKSDGLDRPVKNVILLIGDGTSWPQLYAGYTANRGELNIFKMLNVGLSKTSSYDAYITDSAPGSTAFSSGEKTNNRAVGVDHTGKAMTLLPKLLSEKRKVKTGLITCGDIADATPADFYAHQPERDNATSILRDLEKEPIDILMGSGDESLNNVGGILLEGDKAAVTGPLLHELESSFKVVASVDSVKPGAAGASARWIVVEKQAGLSMLKGRGDWLQRAFDKTVGILSTNKAGFFMMAEGAQVDYGGHSNNIGYVATEVMDFDKTVGEALRFADANGETLVIVTADHETGGLTLLDGDYKSGYVAGQFSTNDHTALPVPVFAYGPRSGLFKGVYENSALFAKILQAYGVK